MTERPVSPTFFTSALGSYDNNNILDPNFNFDMGCLDGSNPQPDGNRPHGDLAMGSPTFHSGEPSQVPDLSTYFPPSPTSPENNQWEPVKPQPHQQSGLPDLDGMNFGEQLQSLQGWPGTKMEQTLTEYPMRQPSPLTNILTNGNIQTSTRGRHGQITPPSDSNPSSPLWRGTFPEQYPLSGGMGSPETTNQQNMPTLDNASAEGIKPENTPYAPSRKRTRAAAAEGDTPTEGDAPAEGNAPTEGNAPKRRRNQSRKSQKGEPKTKEEQEKREKFLERNRIAASKCREKKKLWFENLGAQSTRLYKDGIQKRLAVKQLRDELICLKDEILSTRKCGCPGLIDYINREANSITDRNYPLYSRAGPPDSPMPPELLAEMM